MNNYTKRFIRDLKDRRRRGYYLSIEELLILSNIMKQDLISGEFEDCCICSEPMNKDNNYDLDCCHLFHLTCLKEWIKIKKGNIICPICRQKTVELDEEKELNYWDDLDKYIY